MKRLRRLASVLCVLAAMPPARAELELEALAGCPDELVYHLRLESPKASELTFSMVWNYADLERRGRLDVKATPAIQSDELLGGAMAYELWQGDSLVTRGRCRSDHASTSDRGLSAVLTYNSTGSFVQIGDASQRVTLPVVFDASEGQVLGYDAPQGIKVLRNDIRTTLRTEPRFAPFADVAELAQYLRTSRDPRENVWTYLDRNTDPQKSEPGGRYTLATMSDGDGGYLIVYLGGATYARNEWQPLQIKGQLRPTIFRNHFDLEWYDTRRRVVAAEANASITTQGTVLELVFPLLNSTLRFAKASADTL